MAQQPDIDTTQPMPLKVNPRKWTTKVNVAMIVAVLVVVAVGTAYAIHANRHRADVHDDLPPPSAPVRDGE
jgi:hypothetical protein